MDIIIASRMRVRIYNCMTCIVNNGPFPSVDYLEDVDMIQASVDVTRNQSVTLGQGEDVQVDLKRDLGLCNAGHYETFSLEQISTSVYTLTDNGDLVGGDRQIRRVDVNGRS